MIRATGFAVVLIAVGAASTSLAQTEPTSGATRSITVIEAVPTGPAGPQNPVPLRPPEPDAARSDVPGAREPGQLRPADAVPPSGPPGGGSVPVEVAAPKPPASPAAAPPGQVSGDAAPVAVRFVAKNRFAIGEKIQVEVRSTVAGYLVLIDVDAEGRVNQIYPNIYSMAESGTSDVQNNLVKPGSVITVPDPTSPMANFEYMAGPPAGDGKLFAILSDKPVQYIDLPDLPKEITGDRVAAYVQQATRSLRITPATGGPLLDPHWTFAVAPYTIEGRAAQAAGP